MTEVSSSGDTAARMQRADSLLSAIIIILIAALIGAVALFGYTFWQSRVAEKSATPAQRALQELSKFAKSNPNNAAARVRYGEALSQAGLFEQASAQFKNALKIDPKHTGAWLDLGMISMETGSRADAERYFAKVVELTEGAQYERINQRREQALFHLGEIALDDKRYEEAAGEFKAALRIRKDASDTYYLLAQSLVGLGKSDAALEQLDAALAFDPNYAEAHYLYGRILLDRGDKVNAAVHIVKSAGLAPEAPLPQQALAELGSAETALDAARSALGAKRYSSALDSVLLARTLDAKSADAAALHVRILVAKGDATSLKAAKAVLKEAEALDPELAELRELRTLLSR